MKLNWKHVHMLWMLAVALPLAGCGGFSATKSVSPLDFLLPGGFLLQNDPLNPTNHVVPAVQPTQQLALAK